MKFSNHFLPVFAKNFQLIIWVKTQQKNQEKKQMQKIKN